MSKTFWFTLLVFLSFTLAFIEAPLSKVVDENGFKFNWVPYSSGIAQAKAQNKAVLLFFCADWCATCVKMEKETFKDKSVISYLNANFISIKVMVDREQKIANEYRVIGPPTTVLIRPNGESSGLIPGFIPADRLLRLLKRI